MDIHNRTEVRAFYNTIYRSSENVPMDSSASSVSCNAGTNSFVFRDATIRRINFCRALAGIWANVREDRARSADFQQAAYMCSRNNSLNHFPLPTWACYTQAGAAACGSANLAMGANGPAAIDNYVLDEGVPNAGHRRWLLNPPLGVTALGDVPPSIGLPVNAMNIFESSNVYVTNRDGFVSWPPPGFVPSQLVSSFWSFSLPGTDYSQVSIAMTSNGVPVVATAQPMQAGYGQDTFVWATSVPSGPVSSDISYTVTLQSLVVGGVNTNLSYSVILFNPANSAAAPAVLTGVATGVTNNPNLGTGSAVVNGTINPGGSFTSARFEYGLTTNYGAASPWLWIEPGTNQLPFSAGISGLASGAPCHYRLVATNELGTATGGDQAFTTPAFFQPGDTDGDGIVSQRELEVVLGNYWPHSPWLSITNVAGLGGTDITFVVSNSTIGSFSVEYTTNLADWQYLGPAIPRFLCVDTNAPQAPRRYYRLRWP